MNTAIYDPQTSELLQIGVLEYLDIAKQERAVQRAQSRNGLSLVDVEAIHALYEKERDLEAMRDRARSVFAEKLGWSAGAPFSLNELRSGTASGSFEVNPCCAFMGKGRSDFFYDAGAKPIGIAGHSRLTWSECRDWGMSQGLQVDALPGSWRSPGAYIACLYTLPGFVNLPKQRVSS